MINPNIIVLIGVLAFTVILPIVIFFKVKSMTEEDDTLDRELALCEGIQIEPANELPHQPSYVTFVWVTEVLAFVRMAFDSGQPHAHGMGRVLADLNLSNGVALSSFRKALLKSGYTPVPPMFSLKDQMDEWEVYHWMWFFKECA